MALAVVAGATTAVLLSTSAPAARPCAGPTTRQVAAVLHRAVSTPVAVSTPTVMACFYAAGGDPESVVLTVEHPVSRAAFLHRSQLEAAFGHVVVAEPTFGGDPATLVRAGRAPFPVRQQLLVLVGTTLLSAEAPSVTLAQLSQLLRDELAANPIPTPSTTTTTIPPSTTTTAPATTSTSTTSTLP